MEVDLKKTFTWFHNAHDSNDVVIHEFKDREAAQPHRWHGPFQSFEAAKADAIRAVSADLEILEHKFARLKSLKNPKQDDII